jgi:hypothetical protein
MRTTNQLINTIINVLTVSTSYSTKSAVWRRYPNKVVLIPTDKNLPKITYRVGDKHFYEHMNRLNRFGNQIHRNK